MIYSTTHNHCNFCDGNNSAEEMIEKAIELNFTDFGMSCHGKCVFDPYCGVENENDYVENIKKLKKVYCDKINVYCGIEQDYYAPVEDRENFDYIIGSVHYLKNKQGSFVGIDCSYDILKNLIKDTYSGDEMAMIKDFYHLTTQNISQYKPDVIGHFDLITKYNENNSLFNENSDEYKKIVLSALEKCVKEDCIFEVNTGAMARGKKDKPYPSLFILKSLCQMNAKITLNADCHDKNHMTFAFDEALDLIKLVGFKEIWLFNNGIFIKEQL
ncbi:MAG: histidinol-phosphatase [Clostridia bacterium]